MKASRGFTLVEVLLVVAVIGVLVAIAVPGLLRGKVSANEASALQDLRSAQASFASLVAVKPTAGVCSSAASFNETKAGYQRGCTAHVLWATPVEPGKTGVRGFGGDATGRICFTNDGTIPNMTGDCQILK